MNMIEQIRQDTSTQYNECGDAVRITDDGISIKLLSRFGTIKTRDLAYANHWLAQFGTEYRIDRSPTPQGGASA